MKLKLKVLIYYCLIAIMISSIFVAIFILIKPPKSINKIETTTPTETKLLVNKNTKIYQYFQSQTDSIDQLLLYIGDIESDTGMIKINIYDGKNLINSSSKKLSELTANSYNLFQLTNIKDIRDKKIKIELILVDGKINVLTNSKYNNNQYIEQNENKLKRSLSFIYIGQKYNVGYIWYFLLYFTVSLMLWIFLKDELKKEGEM